MAHSADRHASEEDALSWEQIRYSLSVKDECTGLFLDVFESAFAIATPTDAFLHIKVFLGTFLIRDWDYKGFCRVLGRLDDNEDGEDDESWHRVEDSNLDADLGAAASLMLRLAVTIAKANALQKNDWKDVNEACGNAVRCLPACYRLQRKLPGALDDARALRAFAQQEHSDSDADLASINPWTSAEGKELFESRHGVPWAEILALTAKDGPAVGSVTGVFRVVQVAKIAAGLSIVHLEAISVKELAAWPNKKLEEGDVILWELDEDHGSLLAPGIALEGIWRLMQSEFCFMSDFERVCPGWAVHDHEAETDQQDAQVEVDEAKGKTVSLEREGMHDHKDETDLQGAADAQVEKGSTICPESAGLDDDILL
eukprot:TRINITY_DN11590_c0_g1_i2.p1 TRINITY_DN11590_c0_g1~~TRINITY_DN11590_c0_g1_i2.p1  ORF type:complete len:371 (+),score=91.18 TRINITY_DN11590_c0_g1_i2:51-1163(+)